MYYDAVYTVKAEQFQAVIKENALNKILIFSTLKF